MNRVIISLIFLYGNFTLDTHNLNIKEYYLNIL